MDGLVSGVGLALLVNVQEFSFVKFVDTLNMSCSSMNLKIAVLVGSGIAGVLVVMGLIRISAILESRLLRTATRALALTDCCGVDIVADISRK